jgi:cell division protein FtsL
MDPWMTLLVLVVQYTLVVIIMTFQPRYLLRKSMGELIRRDTLIQKLKMKEDLKDLSSTLNIHARTVKLRFRYYSQDFESERSPWGKTGFYASVDVDCIKRNIKGHSRTALSMQISN